MTVTEMEKWLDECNTEEQKKAHFLKLCEMLSSIFKGGHVK